MTFALWKSATRAEPADETVATMESLSDNPQDSSARHHRLKRRTNRQRMERRTSQIVRAGAVDKSLTEPPHQQQQGKPSFWLRPVPRIIEVVFLLAILTRKFWLLQGILAVLVYKIAVIVFRWTICILTAKDTTTLVTGVTTYHRLLMKEIRATLEGGKMRMAAAGVSVQYFGTGKSIGLRMLRARNSDMNRQEAIRAAEMKERFRRCKTQIKGSMMKKRPA
jgi:hypothetical protein